MSLRVIPIVCPGEEILGIGRLQQFGYEVIPHFAELLNFSDLIDDYPEDDLQKWLGVPPSIFDDRYRRSLRVSWYHSLTRHIAEPDTTIFAESDVCPCDDATADKVEKLLKEELLPRAKKEGYDVIRLFRDCFETYPEENIELANVKWERLITPVGKMSNDIRTFGTHALVVPMESRRKVAKVFQSLKLPTDIALEYAAQHDMLKILSADANVFMQRTQPKDYIPGKAYSGIMRNFLVCMTSYKRPFDLMRQVYTFMDQSYTSFHMSVIVRGMSGYDVEKFILPSLQHFVDEGRLTILALPHSSCFADTVECLLPHDLSKYDYVCKVDDDDWYSRDYLFTINNFLNYIGDMTHGVYNSRQDYEIQYQQGMPIFANEKQPIYENTLVYPVSIAQKLVEIYSKDEGGAGMSAPYSPRLDENGVVWGDGAFIRKLMEEQGCNDIGEFAAERLPFLSVVNKSNASFLRSRAGDYLPGKQVFSKAVKSGNFKDVPIEVIIRKDDENYQIIGKRIFRLKAGRQGDVMVSASGTLYVRWDDAGREEVWVNMQDGSYRLEDSD